MPSLQEYLQVTQDELLVEHYVRVDDRWVLTATTDPAAVIRLPAINCTRPLAALYRKVVFPANP